MEPSFNQQKAIPDCHTKIRQNIPNTITLLRLIALPHLIYAFNHAECMFVALTIFLASIGTDLLDGYAARKMGATSKFGANLDVTVDFVFITGMYLTFILNEIYPPWLLLVIFLVFAQFVVSNYVLKQTIYDPIGKYFGSILFAGIGATIVFSGQITYTIVTVFIVISASASLLSRITYLLQQRK